MDDENPFVDLKIVLGQDKDKALIWELQQIRKKLKEINNAIYKHSLLMTKK